MENTCSFPKLDAALFETICCLRKSKRALPEEGKKRQISQGICSIVAR